MARDIDESTRLLVIERARRRCEYCLVHEDNAGFPHQIDHIISRKHGGSSGIGNLATLASSAIVTKVRISRRSIISAVRSGCSIPGGIHGTEHFKLDGPVIQPLTAIGEVTAHLLRLNAAERVIERRLFQALGSYRKA